MSATSIQGIFRYIVESKLNDGMAAIACFMRLHFVLPSPQPQQNYHWLANKDL